MPTPPRGSKVPEYKLSPNNLFFNVRDHDEKSDPQVSKVEGAPGRTDVTVNAVEGSSNDLHESQSTAHHSTSKLLRPEASSTKHEDYSQSPLKRVRGEKHENKASSNAKKIKMKDCLPPQAKKLKPSNNKIGKADMRYNFIKEHIYRS